MDIASTKTNSNTTINDTSHSSITAKLKRLKIEESILLQSVNKSIPVGQEADDEIIISNYSIFSEFKSYEEKLNSWYRAAKHAFRDLKSSISSNEMLEAVDIDDIKKCTLELETNIKTLKLYLHKELAALKLAEQQLNQNENENPSQIYKFKKQPRIHTAKYNEIVPSPVKTLMNSPLKSSEVQEFQDFMSNSPNRYGGWNEYYHNIFVNYWLKYFDSQDNMYVEGNESSVENSDSFHLFLRELLTKIRDVSEEEIVAHVRWYSKYLYLKQRKQKAIDKWRCNRQIMRSAKVKGAVNVDSVVRSKSCDKRKKHLKAFDSDLFASEDHNLVMKKSDTRFVRKCFNEDLKLEDLKNIKKEDDDEKILNFLKSTMEWELKCKTSDTKFVSQMNDIENVKKLQIPKWRVGL